MPSINLDTALQASNAALAKAKDLGIALTVSVVDDAGRLVVTLRGDGTGFFTVETSRAKAVASATFRKSTKEIGDIREKNPAFWAAVPAVSDGEMLPATGAVLLQKGGVIIGAIGCGGASPDQDHDCAAAGAAAVA